MERKKGFCPISFPSPTATKKMKKKDISLPQ